MLSRRRFLDLGVGALAGLIPCPDAHARAPARRQRFEDLAPRDTEIMTKRFLRWFRHSGIVSSDPRAPKLLFNFYDARRKRGIWIYPMLGGEATYWLLRKGYVREAHEHARALLPWQQLRRDGKLALSHGAFPARIELTRDGVDVYDWYYSGDGLAIMGALLAVYKKTKDRALLDAAIRTANWITQVMCKGHQLGLWVEDHGAPMYVVRGSGDFGNMIHNAVEMLWISALYELGNVTRESAYRRQAERAFAFYRRSQLPNGAFLDHYDPEYPPKPYNARRWKPYQPGQIVGDNVLRSALGACRFGDLRAARRLYDWLKLSRGGVPAAIDQDTGGSWFPPGQPVYFDVSSIALHRSLALWLGERQAALPRTRTKPTRLRRAENCVGC